MKIFTYLVNYLEKLTKEVTGNRLLAGLILVVKKRVSSLLTSVLTTKLA